MEYLASSARSAVKFVSDIRVIYALVGMLLSIVAHELVHVLMHFGDIQSIHFFPNVETIVAMNVGPVGAFSLNTEEFIAYGVTVLIQFITIFDVFAIHDSRDTGSAQKLLFGEDGSLTNREHTVLLQLVSK